MIAIEKIHLHQAKANIEFSMNPSGSDFLPFCVHFHSNINQPYHHNLMLKMQSVTDSVIGPSGNQQWLYKHLSGIRILKEKT